MDSADSFLRSYLYVPGVDEHRITKALESPADAIVIDLEDAVTLDRKSQARRMAGDVISTPHGKPVFVRINSFASGLADQDMAELHGPGLSGIRLPKTESADQVNRVAVTVGGRSRRVAVVALIESALGLERAASIAAAEGVTALALGEADLGADLGVTSDEGLLYSRSRCVAAARASDKIAIQSVYSDLDDLDGLAKSTLRGRQLGFTGRSAVHPTQVNVINDVLTPTDEERHWAEEIIGAYQRSVELGSGVAVTANGRFIDEAVVRSARTVLRLAELSQRNRA
ncbi:MAG: HpcH/HpaI aldolase/citrate lyase family protein [Acidimicrobiales bacterium]